jgi:K+/H+ antiporter YhaU regulatory subunit KhtT
MGAGAIMNFLQRSKILMVAEGLDVFEVAVSPQLAGRPLAQSGIRERTGCSVVAIRTERGMEVVPSPGEKLPAHGKIVLIGTAEAEKRFLEIYGRSGVAGA